MRKYSWGAGLRLPSFTLEIHGAAELARCAHSDSPRAIRVFQVLTRQLVRSQENNKWPFAICGLRVVLS